MSQEERIRRAEEIYQRRKSKDIRINTGANLNDTSKNQVFIFKNLFLKITICAVIYTSFYVVKNSNYFFSKDVLNKVNEILSYDMNFKELYNNTSEYISNFYNWNNKLENKDENNQNLQNNNDKVNNEESKNNNDETEDQNSQDNNENRASSNEVQINENQNNEIKPSEENTNNVENINTNENQSSNMARYWRKRR